MAEPALHNLTAGHACAATPAADCTVATGVGTVMTAAQAGAQACYAVPLPVRRLLWTIFPYDKRQNDMACRSAERLGYTRMLGESDCGCRCRRPVCRRFSHGLQRKPFATGGWFLEPPGHRHHARRQKRITPSSPKQAQHRLRLFWGKREASAQQQGLPATH